MVVEAEGGGGGGGDGGGEGRGGGRGREGGRKEGNNICDSTALIYRMNKREIGLYT